RDAGLGAVVGSGPGEPFFLALIEIVGRATRIPIGGERGERETEHDSDPVRHAHQSTLKARMKQDAGFFEGVEPQLLYIAKKLRDALKLEELLTAAGIDYGVEADQYRGGGVFPSVGGGGVFFFRAPSVLAARDGVR